jgi:hypothetical protein
MFSWWFKSSAVTRFAAVSGWRFSKAIAQFLRVGLRGLSIEVRVWGDEGEGQNLADWYRCPRSEICKMNLTIVIFLTLGCHVLLTLSLRQC